MTIHIIFVYTFVNNCLKHLIVHEKFKNVLILTINDIVQLCKSHIKTKNIVCSLKKIND